MALYINKTLKDRYIYPDIFDYADDGINISFPDLKRCFTCAQDDEEAPYMTKDVLGPWMQHLEKNNEIIPNPSKLNDIELKEN